MTEPRISMLNLTPESFPLEIFGYAEDAPENATPIYHQVLQKPDDDSALTIPLPRQRMRLKVVCANGDVYYGTERE